MNGVGRRRLTMSPAYRAGVLVMHAFKRFVDLPSGPVSCVRSRQREPSYSFLKWMLRYTVCLLPQQNGYPRIPSMQRNRRDVVVKSNNALNLTSDCTCILLYYVALIG